MKGSKRDRWYKDGLKVSRKWYKSMWNRKVRRSANLVRGSHYKRLAGVTAFEGIS